MLTSLLQVTTGKAFYGMMDQAIKRAFAPTDQVLFIHTGNPFTLLEHRHLFNFQQSTPTLDPSILSIDHPRGPQGPEEDEEVNEVTREVEKENKRRAKAFELDIEEDDNTERFRLLIK